MIRENLILETERLFLEKFTAAHADFVVALLNSPGFLRFIGDRGVRSREDGIRYIEQGPMIAYTQYGYGFGVVKSKATGKAVGGCGLIRRAGLDHPDIGFALLPEYTGRGYAYEIAAATLKHAKDELGIAEILGITLPENTRSIHLLAKIGLTFQKMIRLPGDPEEVMLFGVKFY